MAEDGQLSGSRRSLVIGIVLIVILLCVGGLAALTFLAPLLTTASQTAYLRQNFARYTEVSRLIVQGEIPGGSANGERIELPAEYRDLSPARDGEILVYRQPEIYILFYPESNNPWTTQVYQYSSNDSVKDLHGECSGVVRVRANWYMFHCP